jgi:N-acetylmuramoyl-L-alanine amidase
MGVPGRRCRLPELSPSYASESDPIQRLLAFAYQQAQTTHRDAAEELRKDADTLSAVLSAQGKMAVADFDLPAALAFIAEGARRLTGAGGAGIALREGQKVVCRGRSGLIAPDLGAYVNPESGVCGECLISGEVQLCDDTEHDSRVDIWVCRNLGMRSILAVPLRRQQDVLGIIVVFSGWAGVFGERDIRALKLLAGLALEALWANEAHQRAASEPGPFIPEPEPIDEAEVYEAAEELILAEQVEAPKEVCELALPPLPAPPPEIVEIPAPVEAAVTLSERVTSTPAEAPVVELPLPGFAVLGESEPSRLWRRLAMVAAALVVLAGGTEAVLWRGTHLREALHLRASAAARVETSMSARQPTLQAPSGEVPENAAPEISSGPVPTAGPSKLTSIRSWSKQDGTTVALFLEAPARWASGALKDPDRIYLDLDNTQLAGDMAGKSREGMALQVDDAVVKRVRVGQREGSGVRVVIDLAAPAEYSAVISPAEPYRLMIVVRGTQASSVSPADPKPAVAKKTTPAETGPPAHAALSRPKIVIDPGHGGTEEGAVGHGGLKEKDLTLQISKRLGELLASRLGAEVIYTRTSDLAIPLDARAAVANQAGADLFISIHANSSDDINARGIETYYVASAPAPVPVSLAAGAAPVAMKPVSEEFKVGESHKLAVEVQQAMYHAFGGEKGVLNRGVKQAPFIVLLDATMPSILAEVAFVSNTADEQKLSTAEGQEAVADALYRGIAHYLATAKRDKVVASVGSNNGQ